MKRKWHRTAKSGLWLLGLLLFFQMFQDTWAADYVMAQDAMEAEYGDGSIFVETAVLLQQEDGTAVVRAGRNFGVEVCLLAKDVSFEGKINVLMLNEAENHVCFSKEVSVEAGESQPVDFLLPMNLKTDALVLSVEGEDGHTVIEQTIPLEVVNYGDYLLVGICAEDFSEFDYFHSFGNSLIRMEETDFSYGAGILDALDVIVAEEAWLERLEATELSCLLEWVEEGGMLVLGANPDEAAKIATLNLGLQSQSLLQELLAEITAYETERNSVLAGNEEIRKKGGVRESYIGRSIIGSSLMNSLSDEMIRLPVVEDHGQTGIWDKLDSSGAEAVWVEGKKTIVENYPFYRGGVLAFSIPLAAKNNDIYPLFYYRIVQMVRENMPEYSITKASMEKYGVNWSGNTYLLRFLEQEGREIPISPYIAVLLLYILVLIPLAFLLLRNFGKSKYLWGVLPALSFGTVFAIYEMGSSTRIEAPYCSYLNVVDYTGTTGKGTLDFCLSAPTNEGAEITLRKPAFVYLEETDFFAYNPLWYSEEMPPRNILSDRKYKAAITTSDRETEVKLREVAAFSQTSFQALYEAGEMGSIGGEVTVAHESLDGNISNQTGIDFEEVYLYSNNIILSVDGLEDQETIELRACDQVYFSSEDDWYDEELAIKVFGEDTFSGEEGIMRNLIYDYVRGRDGQGGYVFTIPAEESGQNPLEEKVKNSNSYGMEVLIYFIEIEEKEFEAEEKEFEIEKEEIEIEKEKFELEKKEFELENQEFK